MAESLLLPLLGGVASKATCALVETVTHMFGLENDRQTLERQLLAIECKLANAEERSETNRYVKSWMKELKSVAYKADNVLDDFQYEALRRQSKSNESTSRMVLGYITRHSPLLFRFEMSRKLKNVLKKINKLVEEMNRCDLENSVNREERQNPWRQTHSKLDETTKIFGRDDDKEVVVKLLLDQQDQRRVQVLPIIGMGGLGKTTLAKMVYNDQGVHQHFKLKMWHCVSDNFDVIALLKSIIELAVNGRCDMPDTIELLRKQLEKVIGQNRFMLVLDDVWNEDESKWEDVLKPLLCSIGGSGSTLRPRKITCLNEQDSWEVFAQNAYSNGGQEEIELTSIGRCIVNKCRGLPLALRTMGGLLGSYQQVQEWKAIEEIFPKDYEMDKDKLIQLWMANGFIQEKGTMDLTRKGEIIFDELVWRSFLQDKQECKHRYDECASIEELTQQKALLKDVSHMQVTETELQLISGLCKGRTYLRTLLSPSEYYKDYNISLPPDSICVLYNLQTLRLMDYRELQQLPEHMARLRKLIYLYLYGCYSLKSMSRNFGLLNNLYTLTTFVVDTGDGLGIEQLKDLQHLSNRLELWNLSKIKSGENAKEANLSQKQNLCELLFSWDQEINDGHKDMACKVEEVLQGLEPHSNIQKLEIIGYGGLEISQWMRKPRMFNCLRELEMSDYLECKSIPVVWFSTSLEILSLQKMDNLTTLCNNLDVDAGACITPLQSFPRLKRMYLNELPSLEIWEENSVGEPFSLVFMSICLGTWPFLVRLTLWSLEDIAMFPLDAQHRQSESPLEKLKYLGLRDPYSLDRSSRLSILHLMPWKRFSFVEELTIGEWNTLVRWPTEELRCLDRLRVLSIDNCYNLEGNTSLSEEETLPLSLEELTILYCESMVALPPNLGNLAKLRRLVFTYCTNDAEKVGSISTCSRLSHIDMVNLIFDDSVMDIQAVKCPSGDATHIQLWFAADYRRHIANDFRSAKAEIRIGLQGSMAEAERHTRDIHESLILFYKYVYFFQ
ncbi:putative disease resistance protein RGA1 [Triticum aestivum]|uniref:putative disease resistance protein RGA1 n=1 Tax=Triticum aestivum TaxID=4565 RepID=UPI001D02E6F2|nr:putative disease resistance protein RGA1 [Triticum aestivum]